MEQDDRIVVMNQFRRGNFRYLIATDVAARGIDIDHVTHVINYDLPRAKEHYVHRIGRTGRNGRKGIAVTFYTKKKRLLHRIYNYIHVPIGFLLYRQQKNW